MDILVIFLVPFFLLGIIAPIYYLWNIKRSMPQNSTQNVSKIAAKKELDKYVQEFDSIQKWLKKGKIVHPITYVNGGISRGEVKQLSKGINPIRHTHIKFQN